MTSQTSKFIPANPGERIAVGLVLQIEPGPPPVLARITHVFARSIYVMRVSSPAMARYARRPHKVDRSTIESHVSSGEALLGRLLLPQQFLVVPVLAQDEEDALAGAYDAIEPLIAQFDREDNLARSRFTVALDARASELSVSVVSLRRLLYRYYYFGRMKEALVPLRPGRRIGGQRPKASIAAIVPDPAAGGSPKRRGRQPLEAAILGPNNFVATDDDVFDMVDCLDFCANRGRLSKVKAHKDYIELYFSKRHPETYNDYLAKKCPLPVTYRQFRDVTNKFADVIHTSLANAPKRRPAGTGTLLASGPGEVYEIDATGGRIFVVDSANASVVLGTPIIYLLIDRWSRFVVSVYVTLRPASWEEIRYALLIAFTSRVRRFRNLGINVEEARWPRGRVCARLVLDRGSEMISEAMLEAAVDGLHIETETLPPYCPDGKGIIERLNRELKRKMAQRGIKGVYAERPMDPKTKRVYKNARLTAVHSLREVYWALVDIVDEHNNHPHSALVARTILRRARVKPTPTNAYVWGLKNITGIQSPPLTDADYQRLLLGVDSATIANGIVNYRTRRYMPMNAAAERQARLSTSRRRGIRIKVDRSDPVELFVPNSDEDWPRWEVDQAGLQQLREITLEEEDMLAGAHKLLIAETRNDAFVEGLVRTTKGRSNRQNTSSIPVQSVHREASEGRDADSRAVKRALSGKSTPRAHEVHDPIEEGPSTPNVGWEEIEKQERQAIVERQRKRARK